jgi:hypothetical protein
VVIFIDFFEASTVGETPIAPKILLNKENIYIIITSYLQTEIKVAYGRFSIHDNKI